MSKVYAVKDVDVIDFDPKTNVATFTVAGGPSKYSVVWDDLDVVAEPEPSGHHVVAARTPPVGKVRVLLSHDFLAQHQITFDARKGMGKYPERLADESQSYTNVPFRITRIVVSGVELVTGEYVSGSLDLMDPRIAAMAQSFRYDETSQDVQLALTTAALEQLGISR